MRIHTNTLTPADLQAALSSTGLAAEGVTIEHATMHGSRSHTRGIEFRLAATPGRDRFGKARRRRNTGTHGSEDAWQPAYVVAATYAEHGVWMAELYERDPEAVIGYYKGADDFHAQTRYEFVPTAV